MLPYLGITEDGTCDHQSAILLDDFRGNSDKRVKEKTCAMKNFLAWLIMAGGITPKAQPLDVLINKVFKGYFRDLFEEWSLNAPLNEKTGNPLAPSRQLLAKWVVEAWEKVPAELIKKAWVVCGYKTQEELAAATEESSGSLVVYSPGELGKIVERAAGEVAAAHFLYDPENEPQPMFPDSDDDEECARECAPGYDGGRAPGELAIKAPGARARNGNGRGRRIARGGSRKVGAGGSHSIKSQKAKSEISAEVPPRRRSKVHSPMRMAHQWWDFLLFLHSSTDALCAILVTHTIATC